MKAFIKAVVALVFVAPVVSYAQGDGQSLTRAQVRADLVQAEKSGYGPTAWADFPDGEVQAAKFRLASQKAAAAKASGRTSQPGDIAR